MSDEPSSLTQTLQRSLVDLTVGFDSMVEAFSRAMEMREGEPLGHTRQVTEITISLAKAMGVKERELAHIRRGALLHDIGKMSIPESILNKKTELTQEERKVIQQHPIHAYDLLFPIVLLHPAIEIPYCHHERWDGSGYPQRLKGNKIPQAARIFAVVDVWDALTSDRPYRKAHTQHYALEYITNQADLLFDPQVVQAFLNETVKKRVTRPLVK